MAGIPPNWMGSIIQGHGAAERAGERSAKERAAQAESDGQTFASRLQDVVEAGEGSGEVAEDAEGQGSQGRATSDAEEQQQDQGGLDEEDAAKRGSGGLDLEA
jgi:hypothetical protein